MEKGNLEDHRKHKMIILKQEWFSGYKFEKCGYDWGPVTFSVLRLWL
jgi:hypothetical protein